MLVLNKKFRIKKNTIYTYHQKICFLRVENTSISKYSSLGADVLQKKVFKPISANAWLIPWSARSHDLNPLNFYLWGHLNQLVYASEILDEQIFHAVCCKRVRNAAFPVFGDI